MGAVVRWDREGYTTKPVEMIGLHGNCIYWCSGAAYTGAVGLHILVQWGCIYWCSGAAYTGVVGMHILVQWNCIYWCSGADKWYIRTYIHTYVCTYCWGDASGTSSQCRHKHIPEHALRHYKALHTMCTYV